MFGPSQQWQSLPLKRKASRELPTSIRDFNAEDNSHPEAVKTVAKYDQIYRETTAEIKRLLSKYSSTVSASPAAGVATTSYEKSELQVILDDLASRPEFVQLEEVRDLLSDCGIEVQVRQKANGGKDVSVRMKN